MNIEINEIAKKLTEGQKHIMRLVDRDKNEAGWTPVSAMLYYHIRGEFSTDILDMKENKKGGGSGGFARLTEKGNSILAAMIYL